LTIGNDGKLGLYLFDPASKMFTERANVFPSLSRALKLSVGDFDNNGFLDIIVSGQFDYSSNSNRIFLNQGNLQFTSVVDPVLDGGLFGTAIADVNKDGHLDMIAVTGDNYDTKRVLLQGTANENHWLRIKLKGVGVNKFGIGARVRLFTANSSQVREIRSGSGGTFTDEQVAHFGLGTTATVDYIKVEWSSGEDQWIANSPIDTEMIVEQESTPGPPAPAAPSNLEATLREPRFIDLQWTDNSDNEKFFRIERVFGRESFETFKKVSANTTTYTDSTFVDNSRNTLEIKYRVVAVSDYLIESDPSNEVSVTVITGIEGDKEGLDVYPQPASSKVFIRSERQIQSIAVISGQGQVVLHTAVNGSREVQVPLNGLASGIYFLKITDVRGTSVRKIIVASGN
jgi:hypothetical protein